MARGARHPRRTAWGAGARTDFVLTDDDLGRVVVGPRAIERAAELATRRAPGVHGVKARLGEDDLTLIVHAGAADRIPDALYDVQDRARAALQRSGLPNTTVRVTVTRFTAPTTREQLR